MTDKTKENERHFESALLEQPPIDLAAHSNKKDVLNFMLDRIFADQLIENVYLNVLDDLMTEPDNRKSIIKLLEKDYENFKLDPWKPELAANMQVTLPGNVFRNIYDLLQILLDKSGEPTAENIEELMRVFLFTRLFVLKGPQRELFVDMAGLTPFNKREFWELQVSKRSDYEDLLRCMRISRIDAKVISEILADTLSEEQKKLIEVESKTTGEDESSQKSSEERIEKRQDRQSIFDGFLNSVTNFKMPKIEKADQMLDEFIEKTEQQVRRSSQAFKAKMSDAELFKQVNQKNGRS